MKFSQNGLLMDGNRFRGETLHFPFFCLRKSKETPPPQTIPHKQKQRRNKESNNNKQEENKTHKQAKSKANKTEQKIYDAVKPIYPTLITQFKQDWCKKSRCLPFDFCIPEHNIIIELDGAQHFEQVSNWNTPEETFENDLFKEKCANENGYSIIRILQNDVFSDKYDWLSKLQTEIENIIKDDTIIHNIYMCENGEYDKFIIE